MAIQRIRGEWLLSLVEQGLQLRRSGSPKSIHATLAVTSADRSKLRGRVQIGSMSVEVDGRVKIGNPGIVTLIETNGDKPVYDGLEAILYIPPFWPNLDYEYDMLVGVLTISSESGIRNEAVRGRPLAVSGVKALPASQGGT